MTDTSPGTVGIGVITCDRPQLFTACLQGLPEADFVVVVNDGEPYPTSFYPSRVARVIQHRRRLGVAAAKNDALKAMREAGCRHLFLCEDDIRILHPGICRMYIDAAEQTGILHFNYGYHGPRNKDSHGRPAPRLTVRSEGGSAIALNRHLVGAFSYYRSDVLERVGVMDERFRNMLDHVEHTYRIIQAGFHPPFWWFADLADSGAMIEDMDPDLRHSTMKYASALTQVRFRWHDLRFWRKHGKRTGSIEDVSEADLKASLDILRVTHGRHA